MLSGYGVGHLSMCVEYSLTPVEFDIYLLNDDRMGTIKSPVVEDRYREGGKAMAAVAFDVVPMSTRTSALRFRRGRTVRRQHRFV